MSGSSRNWPPEGGGGTGGSIFWGDAVANFASLPVGQAIGELRQTMSDMKVFRWNGTGWDFYIDPPGIAYIPVDLDSEVDGVLAITNGGTNSSAPLAGDRVMISSSGAIIESAITKTELEALDNVTGSVQTQIDEKVAKSGDTMTGPLVLSADPADPMQPATKQYTDAADQALSTAMAAADALLQADINTRLSRAGGTMTGAITLSGDPLNPLEPASKQYVDALKNGLRPKDNVIAATTANITLSGPQTIDGVSVVAGNRVLVKNQTTASENGIRIVAAGAWSRAVDMDVWVEIPGAQVVVEQGTANADTGWLCTADVGGTLNTTAIAWTKAYGAGTVTADNFGVVMSGNQVQLSLDGATLSKSGSGLKVADDGITDIHIKSTADIAQSKIAGLVAALGALLSKVGGIAQSLRIADFLEFSASTTPAAPSAGFFRLIAKATGKFFTIDSSGIERPLVPNSAVEKNYIADAANEASAWSVTGTMTVTPETNVNNLPLNATEVVGLKFLGGATSGSTAYRRFTVDKIDYVRRLKVQLDALYAGANNDYSVSVVQNTALNYGGISSPLPLSPVGSIATGTSKPQATFDNTGAAAPYLEVRVTSNVVSPAPLYVNNFTVSSRGLDFGYADRSSPKAGSIQPFAGSVAPEGWLFCDGSEYAQTAYPDLFARIGSLYNVQTNPTTGAAWAAPTGGNFRVPDYRGIMLKGVGTPNGGSAVALGGYQLDQNKSHTHNAPGAGRITSDGSVTSQGLTYYRMIGGASGYTQVEAGMATDTGTSSGVEVITRNKGVNYIIKAWDASTPVSVVQDTQSPIKAGIVMPFAGAVAPKGWAICDGSELSQTTYAQLFATLSTTYNTQTNPTTGVAWAAPTAGTFRIPDYRGSFLRGVGTPSGQSAIALGGYQTDALQGHAHPMEAAGGTSSTFFVTSSTNNGFYSNTYYTNTTPTGGPTGNGNGTPRVAAETRPINKGVNYIIKLFDESFNLAGFAASTATDLGWTSGNRGYPGNNTGIAAAQYMIGETIQGQYATGPITSSLSAINAFSLPLTQGTWRISAFLSAINNSNYVSNVGQVGIAITPTSGKSPGAIFANSYVEASAFQSPVTTNNNMLLNMHAVLDDILVPTNQTYYITIMSSGWVSGSQNVLASAKAVRSR